MPKTTVYAIRDAETKERLTYRYRTVRELTDAWRPSEFDHTGRVVEIYRTTQDLPRLNKRQRAMR